MRLRRRAGWGDATTSRATTSRSRLELSPTAACRRPRSAHERIAKLGERRTPLRRRGRVSVALHARERCRAAATCSRTAAPCSRTRSASQRVEVALPAPGAMLVYPRLVELDRLFSESGAHAQDGRRLLLRRPSGFDLHSVREYQQGESLRACTGASTARRGQLMVKELEDAPRDEIAVLLDADASAVVGRQLRRRRCAPPARSCARTLATNRRAVLVVNSARRATYSGSTRSDGDWLRALELLAAAEPTDARRSASCSRTRPRACRAGARARRRDGAARAGARRPARPARALAPEVSLVWVDAASFAAGRAQPEPALLRLQAAGVPVAVVRRGDDLAAVLAGARRDERMHGLGPSLYSAPGRARRRSLAAARGPAPGAGSPLRGRRARARAGAAAAALWLRARRRRAGCARARAVGRARRPRRSDGRRGFFGRSALASGRLPRLLRRSALPFDAATHIRGCTASSCSRSSASASCSPCASRPRRPLLAVARLLVGAAGRPRCCPATRARPRRRHPRGRALRARRPAARPGRRGSSGAAGACRRRRRLRRRTRRPSRRTSSSPGRAGTRTPAGQPVGVGYVWDSHYNGIQFPKKRTTVFRIPGPKQGALLAGDDARRFDSAPLARAIPDADSTAADCRLRRTPAGRAPTERGALGQAGRHGRRARRRPPRRRGASRSRSRARRRAATSGRGHRRRLRRPHARADATRSGATRREPTPARARALEPSYPADAPVPRARPRHGRTRAAPSATAGREAHGRPRIAHRRRSWPYPALYDTRARGRGQTRRRRTRAAVALEAWLREHRRLHLRRAPAAGRRRAAARRTSCRDASGLLPALRRRDGADAAAISASRRASRPASRAASTADGTLDGHRPRRPRLGRGLVPRLRLAAVRPDPGPRDAWRLRTRASPRFDLERGQLVAAASRQATADGSSASEADPRARPDVPRARRRAARRGRGHRGARRAPQPAAGCSSLVLAAAVGGARLAVKAVAAGRATSPAIRARSLPRAAASWRTILARPADRRPEQRDAARARRARLPSSTSTRAPFADAARGARFGPPTATRTPPRTARERAARAAAHAAAAAFVLEPCSRSRSPFARSASRVSRGRRRDGRRARDAGCGR